MATDPKGRSPRRSRRASAERADEDSVSFRYIEMSALLAALLEQDAAAQRAIAGKGRRITSALTFAEVARGLVRARIAGRLSAEEERAALRWLRSFRRKCDAMSVTEPVLVRAGRPYPAEPIRTLDAIHLATAAEVGEPPQLITLVTRDIGYGVTLRHSDTRWSSRRCVFRAVIAAKSGPMSISTQPQAPSRTKPGASHRHLPGK